MIYGSVCSGIESASLAFKPLGWKCAFLSEIDPFPRAVLQHRFPDIPLHGDFTTIEPGMYEKIDLLVGGPPCQSFSIAGKREGMKDARGNLTIEFARLAQRLKPKYILFENVPGILSSGRGRDFGAFIGALVESGYGIAWRVLDAQFAGVPQRRRRVFLVGCAGGDIRRAEQILFESEGVCGHAHSRRQTGTEVSNCVTSRFGSGRNDPTAETYVIANTVTSYSGGNHISATYIPTLAPIAFTQAPNGDMLSSDVMHCLETNGNATGRNAATIMIPNVGVRRLMPVEAERLQGLPDNWTLVPYRGKPATDGNRYKAIGNAMAVPCINWIARRIDQVAS
jgi:DNA (cytosine-5)-methyltransferase 1